MRRIRSLLMPLVLTAMVWADTKPVDACGVKLLLKTGAIKPRAGTQRSSNPSEVLLLGDSPRTLVRDLKEKGHKVDVAQNVEAAKPNKDYKVVMTNPAQADEARRKYPNAKIVTRSSYTSTDVSNVEASVARETVAVAAARPVVARRERREVVAAGPEQRKGNYQRLIGAKQVDKEEPVAPAPEPKPAAEESAVKPVKSPKPARETKQPEPKPEPKQETKQPEPAPSPTPSEPEETPSKPEPAVKAGLTKDIGFAFGGSDLTGGTRGQLERAAEWMKQNPNASLVIEGHTDTVGSVKYNEWLAQKRADAVRDQLVAFGVDASRLEVVAYGETKPKYSGTDKRNRRVAIVKK